jgi:hypothetical protein
MPCTRHRVFLATLICAAKNLNDSSPKNKHWVRYAQMFSQAEVNLMEKQLLFLLDYNLNVTEDEICHYAAPFLELYSFPSPSLPVTPRLPTGPVIEATKAKYEHAPALDRSSSSSSIGSGSDGIITPESLSPASSPEPRDVEILSTCSSLDSDEGITFATTDTKLRDRQERRNSLVRRIFGRRSM